MEAHNIVGALSMDCTKIGSQIIPQKINGEKT